MKIVVGCVLALLQVLICTLGQGALTLCVRKDGTQRLEWTNTIESKCEDSSQCHCGCHEAESTCSDELPSSDRTNLLTDRSCPSCTDYTLVVPQSTSVEKNYPPAFAKVNWCYCVFAFEMSSKAESQANLHQVFTFRPYVESLSTILASVVIRC